MRREKMKGPYFPMESFLQVKQEMFDAGRRLENEKAVWERVRNSQEETTRNELDEQFKVEFEKLEKLYLLNSAIELEKLLQTLTKLVQQGASARLLGDHELGSYNLAMLVKDIPTVKDRAMLSMITEIIRITIVADANLIAQKAYAGNGGSVSVEWLCLYLGGGIKAHPGVENLEQYACCYKIFPWIVSSTINRLNPFSIFMVGLSASPEVADLQEKVLLALMGYGFSPCEPDNIYQSVSYFTSVAAININWLTILFPFEAEPLKNYLNALQPNMTGAIALNLINGFTSNNKNRKHFRAFFSSGQHWLLQYIVTSAPELIFDLVKRNEQDMLIPFLKNCRPALVELRDANGNTLLHHAVLSRGLMENTIQLLRNAKFSLQAVNREGQTPLAIAVKNNRTELIKWLN
jgi:hypothetical protein